LSSLFALKLYQPCWAY